MGEAKRRKQLGEYPTAAKLGQPGRWVLSSVATQKAVEKWFEQHGIDYSSPGLHDSEKFLVAEQDDPSAINVLARFIEARTYSADELADAERKTRIAAEAVRFRVERDGRPGLCVKASCVLSRMLDELEVWNYTAKANVTIHWPSAVYQGPTSFYSSDFKDEGVEAPHAIVVAPPFTVIDLTIKHQSYARKALAQLLPSIVLTTDFNPYSPTLDELASPEMQAQIKSNGQTLKGHFQRPQGRSMLEVMKQLPPREVPFEDGRLRYAPVGVGGFSERLREIGKDCTLDGLTPGEIFDRDVLPKL